MWENYAESRLWSQIAILRQIWNGIIFTFLFTYDEFVLFVVTADVSRNLIHYWSLHNTPQRYVSKNEIMTYQQRKILRVLHIVRKVQTKNSTSHPFTCNVVITGCETSKGFASIIILTNFQNKILCKRPVCYKIETEQ